MKRINLIPGEENMLPVYEDVIGHGTSVAGIIGSNGKKSGIIGVNPNVEIYSAKVLDDHNSAPISRIIEGIYWAIDNNVDIINFSLGTIHNSRALHQAISEAYKKGIVLIASSGNDNSIEYPAAYEEVISVGSVGTDEKIVGEYNENKVDIYAPGDLVRSVGAFDGTLVSSGTSMAAPHITGIVSILLEKGEKVTPHFLKVLLKESGRQLDNCGEAKIADLEYALSIYDKLKSSYDFSENRFIYFADIEQNNRDIVVDEPEGYVQGRWSGANHEAAVESAAMYGIYDQAVLYLVKYGARIPDRWFPGNSTSENNGAFHGWGNYIANTVAMYRMALEGRRKANLNDISTYEGHNEICKKIRDKINAKIDVEFPTYSETEKELIVLGMALHCETDAFAHKSYYFNGTSWVRYNATDADNINIAPKRFESAKRVAMSWVSHWRNGDIYTTYSPFAIQDYYYDGSFKMEKMIEYSIRCNKGNPLTDTFLSRMQKVSITP